MNCKFSHIRHFMDLGLGSWQGKDHLMSGLIDSSFLPVSSCVSSHIPVCPPQIHLCCGNHSLGSTDVSLSALSAVSVDLESKAATVEGAFILQPPKRTKQALPALPVDLQPTVGVAVTLRREEVAPQVHTPRSVDSK